MTSVDNADITVVPASRATDVPFIVRATNAAATAVVAILVVQVFHEACHGVASVLVGARWTAWNLFAADHRWPGAMNKSGELIIAGNAAIMNILFGIACVLLFSRPWAMRRPTLRLFLLYAGAYSFFTGFGYLLFDPLFYTPGNDLGDWRLVISLLGAGWELRIPLIIVGVAGYMWAFFWLTRSALQFGEHTDEQKERIRLALPLLLVPYVVVNIVFTILSFWHPLGAVGVIITVLQYWFGYIGFFWGFFMVAYWMTVRSAPANPTPLPGRVSIPWITAAILLLVVAVGALLPTLYF